MTVRDLDLFPDFEPSLNIDSQVSSTSGSRTKSALTYKLDSFRQATNGTLGTLDLSGDVPQNQIQMFIGGPGFISNNQILNGTIRKISYYPFQLAPIELQTLSR
jgi:hypothetical protein